MTYVASKAGILGGQTRSRNLDTRNEYVLSFVYNKTSPSKMVSLNRPY